MSQYPIFRTLQIHTPLESGTVYRQVRPARRTANPFPSKPGACHRTKNEGMWPSACITLCCSRHRNRKRPQRTAGSVNGRLSIAEGTFASLDCLGWAQSQLRGLREVDCKGYMAALAHNVLKLVRTLSRGVGPPGPALPAPAGNTELGSATEDAASGPPILPKYRLRQSRLIKGPGLRIRRPHCRRR